MRYAHYSKVTKIQIKVDEFLDLASIRTSYDNLTNLSSATILIFLIAAFGLVSKFSNELKNIEEALKMVYNLIYIFYYIFFNLILLYIVHKEPLSFQFIPIYPLFLLQCFYDLFSIWRFLFKILQSL